MRHRGDGLRHAAAVGADPARADAVLHLDHRHHRQLRRRRAAARRRDASARSRSASMRSSGGGAAQDQAAYLNSRLGPPPGSGPPPASGPPAAAPRSGRTARKVARRTRGRDRAAAPRPARRGHQRGTVWCRKPARDGLSHGACSGAAAAAGAQVLADWHSPRDRTRWNRRTSDDSAIRHPVAPTAGGGAAAASGCSAWARPPPSILLGCVRRADPHRRGLLPAPALRRTARGAGRRGRG